MPCRRPSCAGTGQDQAQQLSEIREPKAWLITTLTRHCIDRLRAAKAQREAISAPGCRSRWSRSTAVEPVDRLELAESLSMALLMMLERLTPDERAAFLLHEVFDTDYPDVARILGKTEPACRQLVHRAKERVKEGKPRFVPVTRRAGEGDGRLQARGGQRRRRRASPRCSAPMPRSTPMAVARSRATRQPDLRRGEDRRASSSACATSSPEGYRIVPRIVNGSVGYVAYVGDQAAAGQPFRVRRRRASARSTSSAIRTSCSI